MLCRSALLMAVRAAMCRCALVHLRAAAVVLCLWAVVLRRPVAAAMCLCLWALAAAVLAAAYRSEPAARRMCLVRAVWCACQAAMAAAMAAMATTAAMAATAATAAALKIVFRIFVRVLAELR